MRCPLAHLVAAVCTTRASSTADDKARDSVGAKHEARRAATGRQHGRQHDKMQAGRAALRRLKLRKDVPVIAVPCKITNDPWSCATDQHAPRLEAVPKQLPHWLPVQEQEALFRGKAVVNHSVGVASGAYLGCSRCYAEDGIVAFECDGALDSSSSARPGMHDQLRRLWCSSRVRMEACQRWLWCLPTRRKPLCLQSRSLRPLAAVTVLFDDANPSFRPVGSAVAGATWRYYSVLRCGTREQVCLLCQDCGHALYTRCHVCTMCRMHRTGLPLLQGPARRDVGGGAALARRRPLWPR